MTVPAADLPLARVSVRDDVPEPDAWYWALPAVQQLRTEGLPLAPVTVLVGENGSGKSTLVEAIATAWHAGLTAQVHHWGPAASAEDAALWRALRLAGDWPRPQGGVWLRGEAMHGLFARIDSAGYELRAFDGVPLNHRSHGEGFLALLESRTTERGLWILDDGRTPCPPPLASSRRAPAGRQAGTGSQVLLATHSPVLAALPDALIYELDGDGFTAREWAELDLVQDWQAFFDDPSRLLSYLLD